MIAACTLVCMDIAVADAWAIEAARGVRVPDTEEQREMVFGEKQ